MKGILYSVLAVFIFSVHANSQTSFVVYPDSVHQGFKVYKGILDKDVLLKDTSFHWYAENQKFYSPLAGAVDALKKNKDSIELVVFMGTWCDDSHFVIPKMYKLAEASGFDNKKITLIGTDRYKKTISHLSEAMNIINVPTIIIMKKGKELGRVVEYGKYGMYDKELAEILTAAQ
jgi:thiol-disulfide isomerase/thioredoxin